MSFKEIVEGFVKEQGRSISWLAKKMGKTVDGLRLGLKNQSVKHKDLIVMAEALNVSPCSFFNLKGLSTDQQQNVQAEPAVAYGDNLKNCRELTAALKDQLKDKERIISLLKEAKTSHHSS